MKEFVGILVVMAILAVIALFLCSADGLNLLTITAPGPNGVASSQVASDEVMPWAMTVVGACAAAAFIWWALGMFVFKAGRGEEGRWITYWWFLMVFPVAASIFAIVLGLTGLAGSTVALIAFYVGGGILFYWLATAMFSPPLTKHVPPGSRMLRFLP